MQKRISILLTIMLVLGVAGYANADTFETVKWTFGTWLNETNTSASWSFNLDTDDIDKGDFSAGDTLETAMLNIYFYDDDDELTGGPAYFRTTAEFADLTADGELVLDDAEIETGSLSFDVFDAVAEDHALDVSLEWLSTVPSGEPWAGLDLAGDFEVRYVSISGEYSAVPVPAALWLMITGLVAGRIGIRRSK